MAYDIQAGAINKGIRAEVVDAMVKQIAARSYKFKQACAIVSTSAWKNTFFREDPAILAGQTGNAVSGIPRGADFGQQTVKWQEVSVRIVKYGLEDNIPWEDILAGDINVQARLVIKLTEAVIKGVDDAIWDGLTESRNFASALVIQSFSINADRYWNGASAAIVDDILRASRFIAEKNYDVGDLMLFISPRDKQSIMKHLADKGAQFPSIATGIVENGRIGTLAGVTLVESNSVTASFALLCKPKTVATWKELVSLRSVTIEDPLKSLKIRVAEEGALEVTDPKCAVLLRGTQGAEGL